MKKIITLMLLLTFSSCSSYSKQTSFEIELQQAREERQKQYNTQLEQIKIDNPKYYDDVKNKRIALGMPEKYLLLSWGEPTRVNETVNSYGISKQYVYGRNYIYVKNGKITSWQKH